MAYADLIEAYTEGPERARTRVSLSDVCYAAAAEYALGSLTHDLVRVDLLLGKRAPFQPIYKAAEQHRA